MLVDLGQLPHDRFLDVPLHRVDVLTARGQGGGEDRALQRTVVVGCELFELLDILVFDQL